MNLLSSQVLSDRIDHKGHFQKKRKKLCWTHIQVLSTIARFICCKNLCPEFENRLYITSVISKAWQFLFAYMPNGFFYVLTSVPKGFVFYLFFRDVKRWCCLYLNNDYFLCIISKTFTWNYTRIRNYNGSTRLLCVYLIYIYQFCLCTGTYKYVYYSQIGYPASLPPTKLISIDKYILK